MTADVECWNGRRGFTTAEVALLRTASGLRSIARPPCPVEGVCRRIGGFLADGGLKDMMARVAMLEMRKNGLIALPPLK